MSPEKRPTNAGDSAEVVVFWRQGCVFCSGLMNDLRSLGVEFSMRNIWDDPEAAAVVRSVARGNETVPTVLVGGRAFVNPTAQAVVAALPG